VSSSLHGSLTSIAARSPWDIWTLAAGFAAHWDGARWRPAPTDRRDALRDVYVASNGDAWAVGARAGRAAIERWDGRRWLAVLPTTELARSALRGSAATRGLVAVSGRSAVDVWAVGNDERATPSSFRTSGVVLHWDGRAWRRVPLPRTTGDVVLRDVTETRDGDAWIVGEGVGNNDGFAARYARGLWHLFRPLAPSGSEGVGIEAITDLGNGELAAAGWSGTTPGHLTGESWGLYFRWDGHRWHTRVPDYNGSTAGYEAIAARSPREVWIADNDEDPFSQQLGTQFFTGLHPNKRTRLPQGWIVNSLAYDGRSVWAVGGIGSGYAHPNLDYDYARFAPLVLRYGC
jgi:hypothetical protein